MDVQVNKFDTMRVAFVRHIGPYDQCEKAWHQLCSDAAILQAMGPETLVIGVCYDDPDVTDKEKLRYDACVTVDSDFVPSSGIAAQEIEGGEYAVAVHHGSYDGLHDCYRWLYGKWLPESGREPKSAPPLEVYRNSPIDTAAKDLITEIRIPLK